MTEGQKKFILNNFFFTEKFSGWRNIAEALLTNGSCIVPNTKNLWDTGISEFISYKDTDKAIECVEVTFDKNAFLNSNLFKIGLDSYLANLEGDILEATNKLNWYVSVKNDILKLSNNE